MVEHQGLAAGRDAALPAHDPVPGGVYTPGTAPDVPVTLLDVLIETKPLFQPDLSAAYRLTESEPYQCVLHAWQLWPVVIWSPSLLEANRIISYRKIVAWLHYFYEMQRQHLIELFTRRRLIVLISNMDTVHVLLLRRPDPRSGGHSDVLAAAEVDTHSAPLRPGNSHPAR